MAKPDVRMDYPKVEKMANEFKKAAQALNKSNGQMKKIAKMMEDGGLQGEAGSAFVEAIRSKLLPAIQKLEDKSNELHKDIMAAKKATEEGVSTARGRFT